MASLISKCRLQAILPCRNEETWEMQQWNTNTDIQLTACQNNMPFLISSHTPLNQYYKMYHELYTGLYRMQKLIKAVKLYPFLPDIRIFADTLIHWWSQGWLIKIWHYLVCVKSSHIQWHLHEGLNGEVITVSREIQGDTGRYSTPFYFLPFCPQCQQVNLRLS